MDYVVANELMNGVGDGAFAPNGTLNRAMVVTVLWRMAGSPQPTRASSFSDVPAGQWYTDAVAWAEENNVVNGMEPGSFAPLSPITREQIAVIFWRTAGSPDCDTSLAQFADAETVSDYAKTAMAWAVETGLFQGDQDGLRPLDQATRAEFATIVMRDQDGGYDCTLTGIIVPAHGTKTVNVTITLSDEDKAALDADFANGGFVEGYVEFYNEDSATHATYLAFYGDWTQAPVMEKYDFRDVVEAQNFLDTTVVDAEGNTYSDYGYTYLDVLETNVGVNLAVLYEPFLGGIYAYAGDAMLAVKEMTGTYPDYSEDRICLSTPDSELNYTNTLFMIPSMLRNTEHLIMTVTNRETGEEYYRDDTAYLPKAVYDSDSGMWQNYGAFTWDGTDENGNAVPSGTVVTVNYDAILPYGEAVQESVWSFDVTVDSTLPVLERMDFDAETATLTVTASDENYLQAIYLYDPLTFDFIDVRACAPEKKGESFTATFDMSDYDGISVVVGAMDYATNEVLSDDEIFVVDMGKETTITYVTPAGEYQVPAVVGEVYLLDSCKDEVEGYVYECWTKKVYEPTDGSDVEAYYPGDGVYATGRNDVYYALYGSGSWVPNDPDSYYIPSTKPAEVKGGWAIVGYPYAFGFDNEDPYVLTTGLTKQRVTELDDATVSTRYYEFSTDAQGLYFNFTALEDGTNAIQDPATQKYLALNGQELVYVDELSEAAKWTVEFTEMNSAFLFNVAQPDMVLLFDDENGNEFKVFDNTKPVYTAANGDDYYPTDWHNLYLYQYAPESYVVDFYVTNPKP